MMIPRRMNAIHAEEASPVEHKYSSALAVVCSVHRIEAVLEAASSSYAAMTSAQSEVTFLNAKSPALSLQSYVWLPLACTPWYNVQ
jgi:hypothetical protein